MNMSKKNYLMFKGFCDYVLENANDEQVEFLIDVLREATAFMAKEEKKESKRNYRKDNKHTC